MPPPPNQAKKSQDYYDKWECSECETNFKRYTDLKSHKKSEHNSGKTHANHLEMSSGHLS